MPSTQEPTENDTTSLKRGGDPWGSAREPSRAMDGGQGRTPGSATGTHQAIVLFDGECNFCRKQVAHLRRLDGRGRLRLVSLHEPWVAETFPDLTHEQLMEQMWVIAPDGVRYGGASALKYLSRRLPILWPLFPALHFPGTMPLWNWMYRQVAKRRYRIAGRHCEDGACSLHAK